ncbi:MAG: SulP family inorganic anion transporter, partial [Cyclobacteriaceae bacterium]
QNYNQVNWYAISIAFSTIIITLHFQKFVKKIPGSIVAILLSTLFVTIFNVPVDTIQSNFGEIPNHFALPAFPQFDYDTIKSLIPPAFAIALLGSIESLLSAVVSDSMIGGNHRSNMELVAQGFANIASSLFGGLPATGAIARTATNIKSGGRTPISGLVHSFVLLLIMVSFAPYAKLIPLSCLAGILMVVAYHMSEWRQFKSILKGNRTDIIIMVTTFFLTVVFDLVIAIEIGIVLSSFMFMKRMSESVQIQNISSQNENEEKLFEDELLDLPKEILLYEINGPLFFGAARQFQETIINTQLQPRIIIIRMRYVPLIDATGYQSLREIIKTFRARGISVILSGINENLKKDFEKHDLFSLLEKEFVVRDIDKALEKARMHLVGK